MARKVALSLIAPANRNARGHRMFVKRKQKAIKWTTGMEPSELCFFNTLLKIISSQYNFP